MRLRCKLIARRGFCVVWNFGSNEDKNEIIFHVKNGMVRGGIITSINHLEISIRCDDVSYIREVK